ncbi:hypothetical protein N2152v2_002852 [Parachlorella kessleri]
MSGNMSGAPKGFPDQTKHAVAGMRMLEGRNIPVIALTAVTAGSMVVWWYRKQKNDHTLLFDSERRTSGLPEEGRHAELAEKSEAFAKESYGRKTAEAAGLMEGDRPMQGIFPTKKIVEKLDQAGLMSETAASKEIPPEKK